MLAGCMDVTCDEGDAEIAMARGLPEQQLARLYEDAEPYATGVHWEGPVPAAFADLSPVALRSHQPGVLVVRLRGCLDHHIDLVVYIAGDDRFHNKHGRVELQFGERPVVNETLWIKPNEE